MRLFAVCALLLFSSVVGCTAMDPPTPEPQVIGVRVTSDPGKPLKDAELIFNGKRIAVTEADGLGQLKLVGKEGESFDVTVRCPAGFESPSEPIRVVLKRLADSKKIPEYAASCPPTSRTVVVAIRAEGGPNLPVLHLGREVARTDESGAAHVLMTSLAPGDQFTLTLDTRSPDYKGLRPQNPVASFIVEPRDDILVFTQRFDREKAPPPVVVQRRAPPKPPEPTGPTRLGD